MNIDLTDRVRIAPDAMFQIVASESVILDLNSEQYFGLDDVGTRIWQLMAERGRLRDVFDGLLDEYNVPPEVLERDLMALVAELSEQGLVVVEDAAESPRTSTND